MFVCLFSEGINGGSKSVVAATQLPMPPPPSWVFLAVPKRRHILKWERQQWRPSGEDDGRQRQRKSRVCAEPAVARALLGKEVGQDNRSWRKWSGKGCRVLGTCFGHMESENQVSLHPTVPQEPTLGPSVSSVSGVCRKKADRMR